MTQKQIENRALTVTVIVNTIITVLGIWMYFITNLQIMFLDGFFSLLALLSTIVAVIISRFSRKATRRYPQGLYFLEPLYAIFKSVLMISLMVYAVINSSQAAFEFFINGTGEIMNTGPIPAYSVAMTALCLGLSFFNRRQYKKTNSTSTILRAEYQTNFIDGLQSASIGVAILILWIIPLDSFFGFLHYTGDFFISIVLVATSIKDPVVLFFEAFCELTGGITTDKKICEAVKSSTGLPESAFVVYKTGMKIEVCIPVSYTGKADLEARDKMLRTLRQYYEHAEIKFIA